MTTIPADIQAKMIEMDTQDILIAGTNHEAVATTSAHRTVTRATALYGRALAALGLKVQYVPRDDEPKFATYSDFLSEESKKQAPTFWDLEATRKLNPGVDIQPHPGGGFTATASEVKIGPSVHVPKPARYDFPEHLRVGGSLFNEGNPADACCDEDAGYPVPPDEEGGPSLYPFQTSVLEDKLRIIRAIVDEQAPFGSDLAKFQRRLQLVLNA